MKKNSSLFIFLLLTICCCKTPIINQKVNKKREGLWIENYKQDSANYKSTGYYKNDDPVKKWSYLLNNKLIKREKYKNNNCYTRIYYENGKIQSKGISVLDNSSKYMHWYYNGNWKFYNNKGKLIAIKKYDKGDLISEKIIKK